MFKTTSTCVGPDCVILITDVLGTIVELTVTKKLSGDVVTNGEGAANITPTTKKVLTDVTVPNIVLFVFK